jgi:hypothetical protein
LPVTSRISRRGEDGGQPALDADPARGSGEFDRLKTWISAEYRTSARR